jgi:hypothetical protein
LVVAYEKFGLLTATEAEHARLHQQIIELSAKHAAVGWPHSEALSKWIDRGDAT